MSLRIVTAHDPRVAELLARSLASDPAIERAVAAIVDDVRARGDVAVGE